MSIYMTAIGASHVVRALYQEIDLIEFQA